MSALLTLLAYLLISKVGTRQTSIKIEEVQTHIGDSVRVCGKVAGTRYVEQANPSPTFLNLGALYPNQLLTIVIWKEVRVQFEEAPELMYKNQEVCVVGKIALFKDRPQIVIYKKEQLLIKQD